MRVLAGIIRQARNGIAVSSRQYHSSPHHLSSSISRSCIMTTAISSTSSSSAWRGRHQQNHRPAAPRQCRSVFTYPAPRKLTDIMKVPLVKKCDPIEIKAMWQEYHKDRKDAFAESLTAQQFHILKERAGASKLFLYPVFRGDGYMMMISQYQETCFLVTYLEDFRKNPQGANPWLCVTLYDEFLPDKGLGLLRCDVSHHLTTEEGAYLLQQMIEYYTFSDKYKTVWQFNHEAKNFSFEKYVRSVRKPDKPPAPLYKA